MFANLKAKLGLTGLVIIGAAIYLLATQYADHREEATRISLPVRAVQTRAAARWEARQIPGCPAVVELLPPPKKRAGLERDFGVRLGGAIPGQVRRAGEALAGDQRPRQGEAPEGWSGFLGHPDEPEPHILGVFDVPAMPNRGEVLATLPADGRLDLTFRAFAPPFLGFRPTWGLGAVVDPRAPAELWNAYALLEPLHLRERWHLRITAGAESRDGRSGAVILTGLEYRHRP